MHQHTATKQIQPCSWKRTAWDHGIMCVRPHSPGLAWVRRADHDDENQLAASSHAFLVVRHRMTHDTGTVWVRHQ